MMEKILQGDTTSRYGMLDRMKADCEYYLGEGKGSANVLWAKDEKEHIANMKALWESFSVEEKPVWLTYDQILDYEKKMADVEHVEEFDPSKKVYEYIDSYGDVNKVTLGLDFYTSNNNLCLQLIEAEDTEYGVAGENYATATVNIDDLPYLHSAIDTNNCGERMANFLVQNQLAYPTGEMLYSGFCAFPVFRFNEETVSRIDPETFTAYQAAHGIETAKSALTSAVEQADKAVADMPKKESRECSEMER